MTEQGHLEPVPVLDRNGQVTAAHGEESVPDEVSESLMLTRSDCMMSAQQRTVLIDDLLLRWDPYRRSWDSKDICRETLTGYSDELLMRLSSVASTVLLSRVMTGISNEIPEVQASEELHFFPAIPAANHMVATNAVISLHGYVKWFTSDDFTKADDSVQEKCRALLKVTQAVAGSRRMSLFYSWNEVGVDGPMMIYVLKDERLVELVINNGDKAEVISDFIMSRSHAGADSVDVGLLEEMLSSVPAGVSDGLL